LEVEVDEIKTVQVDEVKAEVLEEPEVVVTKVEDYSKMTIKELRDVLSRKGISSNNKMKKTDLLQLIETGTQDTLNLEDELNEVNI
jgi:ribosomal protein L10